MQGGEDGTERNGIMASRGERALTGLVILGFIGFLVSGQNGAIGGALIGAILGYFWK